MKNFIKKSTVTTLSVIGLLSAMPLAFCVPDVKNQVIQNEDEDEFFPILAFEDAYVVYPAGSFDAAKFKEILREKDIIDAEGKYTGKWKRKLHILWDEKYMGEDPRNGLAVEFMSNNAGQLIRFEFCPDWNVCLEEYNAFLKECGVEEVTVGAFDDFTSIKDDSFKDREDLREVEIPKSVTSIGNRAFMGCHQLSSISIPSSVKSIGDRAFKKCYHLDSISIPSSVKSIGDKAFKGCHRLSSISIPSSVTSIGEKAFDDCYADSIKYNGKVFNGYSGRRDFMKEYKNLNK